jgi:SAM-dependent methyltransferase
VTSGFYDRLAPYYDLLFQDWEASSARQAAQLDAVIRATWGPPPRRILDAAAGIGTQALGLAARGYQVTASDIAPAPLARCAAEATRRSLPLVTAVADFRTLDAVHGPHDIVLACDNALPHLLTDSEILQALAACYRCLVPGGGFLASIRDYPETPRTGRETHPYGDRDRDGRRYQLFQVWEWDGPWYDLALHVRVDPGLPTEREEVFRSRYYAISPRRVCQLMEACGFEDVSLTESGFYQPLIRGTRGRGS